MEYPWQAKAYYARLGLFSLSNTRSIVDSTEEVWEQLRPVSLHPHIKLAQMDFFFFSRERFDQPLCNMQKWKAAYLWYERTCVFCSRVYCTLFVIVLLQWKVIVRDPVCQRARVFLPLGLVHGCADTSVWSKAPLTSSCLSSTRARIGRLFWTLYF